MGMTPQMDPAALQRLRAMMAQQGGARTGTEGAAPGGGGPGAGGGDLAATINSRLAQLRKVSPQQISQILRQMKTLAARLIVQTEAEIPGVARFLAPILKALDGAMKEASQAAQTASAAGPPIGMSAAGTGAAAPGGSQPVPEQGLRGAGL